ncbi:MAG: GTPase, partial [Desulfovibrionaceae bacterium]
MPATIALIGRPNVGKSTLFNRLLRRSLAITHDTPGVTRDRILGTAYLDGLEVQLIDTG